MAPASLLLLGLILIASALILIVAIGPSVTRYILAGIKRNVPWFALLVATTAVERGYNRLVPDHPYLLEMSSHTEILAGLSTWFQSIIPVSFGPSLFGAVYIVAFLVCLFVLPLYLLAAGDDTLFRTYCLSLSIAYVLLIIFHLAILSVRPGLDPGSGIVGLLYIDPFWGPVSTDLISRGNSLPSGHTTTLVATALAIWPLKRLRAAVLVLFALTVVAILYLGIHWPVDVIIGVVLGAISGVAGIWIIEKLEGKRFKQLRPESP